MSESSSNEARQGSVPNRVGPKRAESTISSLTNESKEKSLQARDNNLLSRGVLDLPGNTEGGFTKNQIEKMQQDSVAKRSTAHHHHHHHHLGGKQRQKIENANGVSGSENTSSESEETVSSLSGESKAKRVTSSDNGEANSSSESGSSRNNRCGRPNMNANGNEESSSDATVSSLSGESKLKLPQADQKTPQDESDVSCSSYSSQNQTSDSNESGEQRNSDDGIAEGMVSKTNRDNKKEANIGSSSSRSKKSSNKKKKSSNYKNSTHCIDANGFFDATNKEKIVRFRDKGRTDGSDDGSVSTLSGGQQPSSSSQLKQNSSPADDTNENMKESCNYSSFSGTPQSGDTSGGGSGPEESQKPSAQSRQLHDSSESMSSLSGDGKQETSKARIQHLDCDQEVDSAENELGGNQKGNLDREVNSEMQTSTTDSRKRKMNTVSESEATSSSGGSGSGSGSGSGRDSSKDTQVKSAPEGIERNSGWSPESPMAGGEQKISLNTEQKQRGFSSNSMVTESNFLKKKRKLNPVSESEATVSTNSIGIIVNEPIVVQHAAMLQRQQVPFPMETEPREPSVKPDDSASLTTPEGQLARNPHMTSEEAKIAAKREYNRKNAARARKRGKNLVEDLQRKTYTLTMEIAKLRESNMTLQKQLENLKDQNQELVLNHQRLVNQGLAKNSNPLPQQKLSLQQSQALQPSQVPHQSQAPQPNQETKQSQAPHQNQILNQNQATQQNPLPQRSQVQLSLPPGQPTVPQSLQHPSSYPASAHSSTMAQSTGNEAVSSQVNEVLQQLVTALQPSVPGQALSEEQQCLQLLLSLTASNPNALVSAIQQIAGVQNVQQPNRQPSQQTENGQLQEKR